MDWSSGSRQNPTPTGDGANGKQPEKPAETGSLAWTVITQEAISLLGRKWVVPVVRELTSGTKRRFQLSQSIKGVTPKVLTETLRYLERDGVIERVLHDDGRGSKSIAYQLTPLGRTLATPVEALYRWGHEHLGEVHRARRRADAVVRD